jgi:hypothetical protein
VLPVERIPTASAARPASSPLIFFTAGATSARRLIGLVGILSLLFGLWAAAALGQSRRAREPEEPEQFSIVNARFLDGEDGYPLPPNSSFYPGEHVHIAFHIGGFHVSEDEYQVKVSYRVDFIGASGTPFATSEGGLIEEEVYPQDENWMPIVRASPRIPFHAESGTYKIRLYARDELRPQEEAQQDLSFDVLGKDIGDATKLTVRNFAFQSAADSDPIETPVYLTGGTVWGSFYITGFALHQNNSFEVDSLLKIINDEGEVLYSFVPQREDGESFYPRRWLPGRFRIDLDKDIPTGEYVLELLVRDKLGNQESLTRHAFRIR